MNALVSDSKEPNKTSVQERVPLSGAKLDAAIKAMEAAGFLEKLTARIMKLAAAKGFYSPFEDGDANLPGGKSAADLAGDILEKTLDGSYTWDDQKQPDFYRFSLSRAESILSNWLDKNRRLTSMSPLVEEGETGDVELNPVNTATNGTDLYEVLRFRDGGRLGDKLLEDFALSLPDNSHEQAILLAVFDDRECVVRTYCRGQLKLSEKDFDAAMKRIRRAASGFLPNWCRVNNLEGADRKEIR